jgi:circadian clock protein KaiC
MEEEFIFDKKKQADANNKITNSENNSSELVGVADEAKNPGSEAVQNKQSVQEPIIENPYLKKEVPVEPMQEKTQPPVQEPIVETKNIEPTQNTQKIVEQPKSVEPKPIPPVEPAVNSQQRSRFANQQSGQDLPFSRKPSIVGFTNEEDPKVEIKTNNSNLMNNASNVKINNFENKKNESGPIKSDSNIRISNMPIDEDSQESINGKKAINYLVEKVPTGITGFDELIGGGLEKDSTVLVDGAVGTGKTLFGLQFLYKGIEQGEPGMFISFEEDRESLYKHAKQFGWDFEKYEAQGKFRLLEFKPHQMTKIIEEGGGSVRDMLDEIGAKRVVVDSITAYGLLFHDEYARRDKVLEFLNSLKKWDVTAIVISEESPIEIESKTGSIGFITDAIISLYYQHDEEKGIRIHSLEVIKMRGSKHTNKLCAMNFEKDGIRVYPDVEVF